MKVSKPRNSKIFKAIVKALKRKGFTGQELEDEFLDWKARYKEVQRLLKEIKRIAIPYRSLYRSVLNDLIAMFRQEGIPFSL